MLETKFSFLDMHIHRSWLRKIVTGMVWIFIAVRLAAAVGTTDTSSLVLEQLERSREQYRTVETWQQRRVQLRDNFLKGAGLWPLPEKSPLNPIVHSRREYDGYSVENIALESMPGFYWQSIPSPQDEKTRTGHSLPPRALHTAGSLPGRTTNSLCSPRPHGRHGAFV